MNEFERVNIEQARLHLTTVAQIFAELGQDKAAAKVRKIADKLPVEKFEDGLYRIDGVPWERLDGEWSSTRFKQTEANDADVVARYGEPVPVKEIFPAKNATHQHAVIARSKLPIGAELRQAFMAAGMAADRPEYQKLFDLADWLDRCQPTAAWQDLT